MITDDNQVGTIAGQQPKQFKLRDVGVLKFVHQDVAIARAKLFQERLVVLKPHDRVHDLRAERQQLAFAEQQIACPISSGNFQ